MQEDTHFESIASASTINIESQPTTYTISSQQSTDFEMIDEGALPILTEGTEESMIARDNLNKSTENVNQGDDIIKSIVSHEESQVVSMVVDNEADQTHEKLSTPERPPGPLLEEQLPTAYFKDKSEELINNNLRNSNGNSLMVREEIASKTEIDILGDKASNLSVCLYKEPILSTPERPSGPLLEERDNNINKELMSEGLSSNTEALISLTAKSPINADSTSEQPNAPERSISGNILPSLDTDVCMVEAAVASINAHGEFDSIEDITVYEVVTEYQSAPPISTANYPHIFLQLRDGQIINVENGEVIISLSQFAANEPAEPSASTINSTLSSQDSPRPLHIDSEYISSTQESTVQQDFAVDDVTIRPPLGVLNQSLLGHEEIAVAETT